jgi:hypothetical protein
VEKSRPRSQLRKCEKRYGVRKKCQFKIFRYMTGWFTARKWEAGRITRYVVPLRRRAADPFRRRGLAASARMHTDRKTHDRGRTMKDGQFWELIGELDGEADEASVHHLTEVLADEDEEDVAAFGELLRARIDELHAARSAVGGLPPLTGGQACAVVAAGRSAHTGALADRAAITIPGDFEEEEALLLLTVADAALELMGALPAGGTEQAAAGVPEEPWLALMLAHDGGLPKGYAKAVHALNDSIPAEPAWQRWWAGADRPRLDIVMNRVRHAEGRVKEHVRRKRREVVAQVNLDAKGKAGPAGPVQAREDVLHCLGVVAQALGLNPLPPLPETAG